MITEIIMHACGWTDVWYAHPGPGLRRALKGAVRWGGRFHVGVWTGEQGDLICVRKCETNAEAEACLSPGSATILGAAAKALVVRLRT